MIALDRKISKNRMHMAESHALVKIIYSDKENFTVGYVRYKKYNYEN